MQVHDTVIHDEDSIVEPVQDVFLIPEMATFNDLDSFTCSLSDILECKLECEATLPRFEGATEIQLAEETVETVIEEGYIHDHGQLFQSRLPMRWSQDRRSKELYKDRFIWGFHLDAFDLTVLPAQWQSI